MKWIVNDPFGFATRLTAFKGGNLTLTNSSATDVYYDIEKGGGTINTSAPGVVPTGTKIANGGGTVQFVIAPDEIWVRAASQTVLDVQGDAPAQHPQPIKVPAGDARGSNNLSGEAATVTDTKKQVSFGLPMHGKHLRRF